MKPLAVMLLFALASATGYAQCADTFEITSIKKASEQGNDGKIILSVNTSRSFTCELIAYKNANRTQVAQRKGIGAATITFEDLNNTDFYRIVFTFPEEEDPFCQSRVLDQIMLTGNKRKL